MPDRAIVETDPRRVGRRRVALLVGGALTLAVATTRGRGRALDDRLFHWANSRFEHPNLDRFFWTITELGSLWASLSAGAAIALAGRRREAADAAGAAVTMWIVGQGLKEVFARVRPYEANLPRPIRLLIGRPKGASWPSSHPAVLLVFVTVASRDLELRRPVRRGLAGLAGLVGASRVYLGVHYPADVAGGLLLARGLADTWSRAVSPSVTGRQPGPEGSR
ncbi:MAG TPA: phosphatase PAP2 family protein [Actinomycetota bacterium]|nr:phosphatase PAP2 family protein [Actinomycetota bacterium]